MNAIPPLVRRADFRFFASHSTRWSDNDMFGHINNVMYYRFFEATVVAFYLQTGKSDWSVEPFLPFAAESLCRFRTPLSFPETIEGALRVERIGTSSVRFGLALFREGVEEAAADGHWVHVFTDRATGRPTPIPDDMRRVFEEIAV